MYFAKASELNDPFEFRWRERMPTKEEDYDSYVRELCALVFPNDTLAMCRLRYTSLKKQHELLLKGRTNGVGPTIIQIDHGIFCMSEINDDILMWSHYANHHRGVCGGIQAKVFKKWVLPVR